MPADPDQQELSDPANRTRLSWSRTAIAFAAIGGAMLKSSPVAGIIVLLLSIPVWASVRRISKTPGAASPIGGLRLVTVTVVLVALAGLAVVVFGRQPASLDEILRLHFGHARH
jgi:uncharacterized membrane protein YidH (DUF202 family)